VEGDEMKVLQIATVGDDIDPILVGIREYPVSKLVLLYSQDHEKVVQDLVSKISFLKIEVDRRLVNNDPIREMAQVVSDIVSNGSQGFEDIFMNATGGEKLFVAGGVLAAYVNGIKVFHVKNGMVHLLPVLKFSYSELISDSKMAILDALDKLGGAADSLNELSDMAKVEKSLLSYHIRGGKDSKGLEGLGLVEIDRATQGRLRIKLTMMGKLMLIGRTSEDEKKPEQESAPVEG
jgi:hypothetical protein